MKNNHTITSQQLLDRLNWRYATKQFDPTRKINAQDWATLEDALLLTPSSGGLQPWKFIVVTDPAVRAKLSPASYGQPQITNASHLVVFAAKKNFNEADVDAFISRAAATRGVDQLGGAGARFLRQEPDAEFLAARREQRVLGVGVLREQARERRRRPQRSVGIRAAGKRIRIAAATLRRDQGRDDREGAGEEAEGSHA